MNKETRSNLIFLAIILAVMIPPAILLFRKKLDPDARIMYLPDPVPHAVAYMVPGPTPPGMSRVVPPKTAAWVLGLTETDSASRPKGEPLMSDRSTFQVIVVVQGDEQARVTVLMWSPPPADGRWSLESDNQQVPGTIERQEASPLPQPVRQELGERGLLRPPKQLTVCTLHFAATIGEARVVLRDAEGRPLDSVPLFTNPVATSEYKRIP
jgi:hypothetical protein